MDDTALLRRYLEQRSETAFTELVRRHINLVYFAALRQVGGDRALAEEVAQLVFTDLARKAKSLVDRPTLAGWLHTSTRFAASNVRRSEQRRQAREQEAYIMQTLTSPAEAAADWEKLRPAIDDALHALDADDREAVLLRFFEGRAFAEIGAALRVSEEAARKRVDRALDRLATALARRGITSTAAALSLALASQTGVVAPTGIATAVAGAALGASTGTAGILGLSTAAAGLAGGLLAIAALALGVTVSQGRSARAAQAELAALRAPRPDMEASLRELERRLAAAEQRAQAADADAGQLLKAVQDAAPKIGFPAGDAVCVAFVIDTSGSMRDPRHGGLWPAAVQAVRETLAAHPDAKFIMGFDADGRIMFSGESGWLPVNAETLSAVEQAMKSYGQDSISNPVPGIYRAMRELPPPGKSGARLHVTVIGDEFIDREEPVMRRLAEVNPPGLDGKRRATISAVQLPTTVRYTPTRDDQGKMGNTGLKFQALMSEVSRQHGGAFKLLPPAVLE